MPPAAVICQTEFVLQKQNQKSFSSGIQRGVTQIRGRLEAGSLGTSLNAFFDNIWNNHKILFNTQLFQTITVKVDLIESLTFIVFIAFLRVHS